MSKIKLLKCKSDVFKPPFNLERIAKGIHCEYLIKSLREKNVDPLILKKRKINPRKPNKIASKSSTDHGMTADLSSTSSTTNIQKDLLLSSVRSKKYSKRNFFFFPQINSKNFPKPRPYEYFLEKNRREGFEIDEKMFDDLGFCNEIKIHNIYPLSIDDKSYSKEYSLEDYGIELYNKAYPKEKGKKQKFSYLNEMERITKINKMFCEKKKTNDNQNKAASCSFDFLTKAPLESKDEVMKKKNNEIMEKNNKININCIQSPTIAEMTKNQAFLKYNHKMISLCKGDKNRLKEFDKKLIKLIRRENL